MAKFNVSLYYQVDGEITPSEVVKAVSEYNRLYNPEPDGAIEIARGYDKETKKEINFRAIVTPIGHDVIMNAAADDSGK